MFVVHFTSPATEFLRFYKDWQEASRDLKVDWQETATGSYVAKTAHYIVVGYKIKSRDEIKIR